MIIPIAIIDAARSKGPIHSGKSLGAALALLLGSSCVVGGVKLSGWSFKRSLSFARIKKPS